MILTRQVQYNDLGSIVQYKCIMYNVSITINLEYCMTFLHLLAYETSYYYEVYGVQRAVHTVRIHCKGAQLKLLICSKMYEKLDVST
jgi:hypothetical protein